MEDIPKKKKPQTKGSGRPKPLTPKVSTTRNGKRRYEEGEFLFINYTNMCSVQFGVNASTTGISVHPDYEAEIRSDNVYQTKYKIN